MSHTPEFPAPRPSSHLPLLGRDAISRPNSPTLGCLTGTDLHLSYYIHGKCAWQVIALPDDKCKRKPRPYACPKLVGVISASVTPAFANPPMAPATSLMTYKQRDTANRHTHV